MGLLDELRDLHPAVLVGGAIAVAGVALVVLLVLVVVLAAVLGSFVLGVGEEAGTAAQAGASVTPNPDEGTVEVVWTSDQDADHLLVEWAATGSEVRPTATTGEASYAGGRVRLSSVGSGVTLAETDPAADTTVRVTVTAVANDERTVIVDREVVV